MRTAFTAGMVKYSANPPGSPVMPCSRYDSHWCESPLAQYSHTGERAALTQFLP